MRQDSRRSLLLWPITASLAVLATTTTPYFLNSTGLQEPGGLFAKFGFGRSVDARSEVHSDRKIESFASDRNGDSSTGGIGSGSSTNGFSPSSRHGFGAPEPLAPLNHSEPKLSQTPAEDAHRPDRGARGLSMPERLVSDVSDSPGTLQAPVVDLETELAGFAEASEPKPVIEQITAAVPASLSPGLEAPAQERPESISLPTEMFHTKLDEGSSESNSLIPDSVAVLAKPSVPADDVPQLNLDLPRFVRPPVVSPADNTNAAKSHHPTGWPLAKQLRVELSELSSHANLALDSNEELSDVLLTSVDIEQTDLKTAHDEMLRMGNQYSGSTSSEEAMRRQATSIVMGRWAEEVDERLTELRQLARLGEQDAGPILRELSSLAAAGLQLAERAPERDQQVRWLQASHSLARRTSVWASIWQLARGHADSFEPSGTLPNETLTLHSQNKVHERFDVHQLIRDVREQLPETGDPNGWATFLLLDKIQTLASSDDMDERALTAQRYLSRITSQRLAPEHDSWLNQAALQQLTEAMKTWSAMPIDYVALLQDLERAEADSIDLAAVKVTNAFQSLRFSDDAHAARVAKAIDLNYRNANVRTAISAKLIERLIPSVPDRSSPIATQIAGTPVRGTSNVSTAMNLRLNPSPGQWSIDLLTRGDVSTQSRAQQSGVTVHSNGWAEFDASTPIRISPTGLMVGGTEVQVNANNRLQRIDSKVNEWPLIGSLVRGIAEKKYQETKSLANQRTRQQIRDEVSNRTQSELGTQTTKAEEKWDDLVLGPLGRLELSPTVIDLETTSERLIARYRLAGDWQLAAHTPRPRAWNDSWLSLQMHQSAINNTLEQILPRGEVKTFDQLYTDTFALFGKEGAALPEEVPGEAEIAFSPTRPMTIEIEDGKMWLTLRVVRLSQPGSPKLTRFIVRAAYKPEIDGLNARLVRDGHLRVSGPGMSMRQRLPIRAVFNKVLAEDRVIPLTTPKLVEHPAMQDLVVSQLELRDGWLALALSPEAAPSVATRPR
ncbi:hypothetical protein [Rhodopirellula bahusiensis]|uniref:Uncharacterized protein n=1 Tax=Rhodopirellula bahusiensis TaxID=2014065 RepID=A0A2G1WD92_9BACT|nr:hypothetical protein [Rhodopirellula bahusiensis]PHQ36579.1 hypothetical protein CEE69_04205 [Rhodopirellula bahusiensis]